MHVRITVLNKFSRARYLENCYYQENNAEEFFQSIILKSINIVIYMEENRLFFHLYTHTEESIYIYIPFYVYIEEDTSSQLTECQYWQDTASDSSPVFSFL